MLPGDCVAELLEQYEISFFRWPVLDIGLRTRFRANHCSYLGVGVKQRRVMFGRKEQVRAAHYGILDAFRVTKAVANSLPRLKPINHDNCLTKTCEGSSCVSRQVIHHVRRESIWFESRRM
jgi:hypothetical protein